ncbi:hypothetical protein JCM11251_005200 [Rhodosporidiobolus azoricus]
MRVFPQQLSGHTWQAWHEHYRKHKDDIDRRIEKYRRQRKRDGRRETPTPEASEEEESAQGNDEQDSARAKGQGRSTREDGGRPPANKQRKARVEFDDEVDWARLIRTCAIAEEKGWSKAKLYQELGEKYPDHAASSWQSWHSKNRTEANSAVKDLLQRKREKAKGKRSEPGSVATASTATTATTVTGTKDKGKGKQKDKAPPASSATAAGKPSAARAAFSPSPSPEPAHPIASTSRAILPSAPTSAFLSSTTQKKPPPHASCSRARFSPSPSFDTSFASPSTAHAASRPSASMSTAASIAATAAAAKKAGEAPRAAPVAKRDKGKGKERARSVADEDGEEPSLVQKKATGQAVRTEQVETDNSSDEEEEAPVEDEDQDEEGEPPFTKEEEEMLVHWLAKGQVMNWAPDNVYAHLERKVPHHPASSWSAHYTTNLADLVMRVAQKTAEVLKARERKKEAVVGPDGRGVAGRAEKKKKKKKKDGQARPPPPSPNHSSRSSERAAAPPPSSTVRDRRTTSIHIASSPVASTSTSTSTVAARPLIPPSTKRTNLAPLEPPTPSPPPPDRVSPQKSAKGKGKEKTIEQTPPPTGEEEEQEEESQFMPFTQVPLPADEEDQLQEEEEDEAYAEGLEEDLSLFPDPGLIFDLDALPAATAGSGASADDQPRLSQYSTMPSPFLRDDDGSVQEEDMKGENDQADAQQDEDEEDEDDREMDRQLAAEVAAASEAVAEEGGQEGEEEEQVMIKVEETTEIVVATIERGREDDDRCIQETFDQPASQPVEPDAEAQENDHTLDDSTSCASLDLDDPSGPIWTPRSPAEEKYLEDLFKLGEYLKAKEEEEAQARRAQFEADVGAATPEEVEIGEQLVRQADEQDEKDRLAAEAEQTEGMPAAVPGSSPPSMRKKRTRSERTDSASVDSTAPNSAPPALAGGTAMGRTPSQLPSPRKKQRVMTNAEENAPSPAPLGGVSVVHAIAAALPPVVAPSAPSRQPLAPAPSPANLAPPPSAAAAKARPPPQSALSAELHGVAAQYQLSFTAVRGIYYCCSAPPDFTILRDMALLHSPACPPAGTAEYERLSKLKVREMWTFAEDGTVLGGSEDERREVERRKGRGSVAKRSRVLTAAKITSIQALKEKAHLYRHEGGHGRGA